MKRIARAISILSRLKAGITALTLLLACPVQAAPALNSITVIADSSLGLAVSEIARRYSRERGVAVNTSFAPTGVQARQIEEGGAADILITPRLEWIEQLKSQGMVDVYSQTIVCTGQLALFGSPDSPLTVDAAQRFPLEALLAEMEAGKSLRISNPDETAEGAAVREALRSLDPDGRLERHVQYGRSRARQFAAIAEGRAYGIFFFSSGLERRDVRVLELLPEASYPPIQYTAVVIAGDKMNEARRFLAYLKSDSVRKILNNYDLPN